MKKTYMNPTMKVVAIKHNKQLLAGSIGLMNEPDSKPTPGTTLAPGFDDFDDFDE